MIGTQVRQFKIKEQLGVGGMGEVYLAEDSRLLRPVALKFLPPHYSADPDFKARFEHEATAAAALNHPNIITVYELGEHEGRLFIALELVQGVSLEQMIEAGGLKLSAIVRIALQIAEGLAAAHEAGIVHRDIKPANIVVDKSDRVKILDFGLAKSRRATTETKAGTTVGTIQYESPEQGRGEAVDQRSDLFSLGVVLYEMVTGRRPFAGEFADAIRYAIANDTPEPMARYKADVPDDLQRIVSKLLEKDPDLRYQTATGLISDLKLLQRSSGPSPSSVHAAARREPRRRRLWPILVPTTAGAAVLLAVLVFKPWKLEVKSTEATAGEERIAVMYFEHLGDPGDTRRMGEIVANLLISNLAESRHVQVVSSQRLYDILKQLGREGTRTISRDVATQVARKANAKWMITGSIMQAEPSIVLSAQLVQVAHGDVLASPTVEGATGESVFRVVDRLTAGVRRSLALPAEPRAAAERPREPAAGKSTEAYRLYLEGRELTNQFLYAEAEAKYHAVLKHDSTFAMAYLGIAQARWVWWRDHPGARRAAARALEFIDHADLRDRYMIRASEAGYNGRSAEAVTHLEALLSRYPDDKEAYHTLGLTYHYAPALRDYRRAIEMFRKVIEIDPLFKDAYNGMAYAYDALGDLEQSIWAIDKYIEIAPDEPNPYDSRGELYARNGQVELALASFLKALAVEPSFTISALNAAGILMLREDYDGAQRLLSSAPLGADPETKSRSALHQAYLPLHQGKFRLATRRLDTLIASHEREIGPNHQASRLYLTRAKWHTLLRDREAAMRDLERSGDIRRKLGAQAEASASIWDDAAVMESYLGQARQADSFVRLLVEHRGTEALRDTLAFLWTRILVALQLERYDSALALVQRLRHPQDPIFYRWVQAGRVYMGARRLRDAVEAFERAGTLYDQTRWENAHMDVLLRYWLGVAYERSGRTQDAVREYRKFLHLWRGADAPIPELAEARSRLGALGS